MMNVDLPNKASDHLLYQQVAEIVLFGFSVVINMELATELATTLKGETVLNYVREVGINANHWYAVAWAKDLRAGQILPVMVWSQSIALFRDSQGQINVVENVCAHKGVTIDKGKVVGDTIVCPYHG